MEQYCDADPRCGPTNSEHLVVNAVRSTGLVKKSKRFYFDQLALRLGQRRMLELLLEDYEVFRPDLVIYTPLGGDLGERLNPPREAILEIKQRTKVFLIVWDAKPNCGLETRWAPFATCLGMPDSLSAFLSYKGLPNAVPMYSAVDPGSYYNKNLKRDIDVSFVGSVDPSDIRWPLRNESIKFLRDNGINIFAAGGQRSSSRLSVEEFCNILNRSKISLNFCQDGNGFPILKSRVFEVTSCGALMAEDRGTDTQRLFVEGKDFIVFKTKKELLDLVRHYLAHDEEREAIARSGYEKAAKIYNARNMWGYIFERMGFEVPQWLVRDENYLLHRKIMEGL